MLLKAKSREGEFIPSGFCEIALLFSRKAVSGAMSKGLIASWLRKRNRVSVYPFLWQEAFAMLSGKHAILFPEKRSLFFC